jgi:site-specific recombinase XerD/ribosomal protein L40E
MNMEERLDIYNFDKILKKVNTNQKVSNKNKKLILEFQNYCFSKGLSKARVIKYANTLFTLAKILKKDFDKANEKDIRRVVAEIEQSNYSAWTKKDFKVALKIFYRWLRKCKEDEYPEEVSWLKTTISKKDLKLPESLLTEEDIKALVNSALSTRDKALIFVLYESGARIGEICSLRIKDVSFDSYGSILIVKGKTGARRVRLIASDSYLRRWIDEHPLRDNPEAPLWVKSKKEPITYSAVSKIIKEAAKRAGLKKRIHAHLFRHSRATFLANYLTEAQLSQYLGWTQGSKMPSIYVHLTGKDLDKSLFGIYGIKVEEERKKEELQPKICPRCKERNSFNSKFCSRCGLALDYEAALGVEKVKQVKEAIGEILELLLSNPEVESKLTEIIEEWKKRKSHDRIKG